MSQTLEARQRAKHKARTGPKWINIVGAHSDWRTDTYVMAIPQGVLVQVVDERIGEDEDNPVSTSIVFVPGASLADFQPGVDA